MTATATTTASTSTQLLKSAVHLNSPLSPRGALERLFTVWFNGFVYNQIWEDPRVDMAALELRPDSRILTISSGGCNILNYLTALPERIIAVDLNHHHMALTRLKLAALRHLPDHEEFFRFFGHADDPKNLDNYHQFIREHLDDSSRHFWEGGSWIRRALRRQRIKYFAGNFYDHAKLGWFLRFCHAASRLTRRDPAQLLNASTIEEQERIFEEVFAPLFDNRLVRLGGKLPISVFSLGIPPAQFRAMKNDANGMSMIDVYRQRVRRLACDFPMEDNYFAWQAFGRVYDTESRRAIPDYLKAETYQTLRDNLHRVETHVTSLTVFLARQPAASMDRFVFLDAQDWMPPAVINELWTHVARVGKPGTRVIFRTAGENSPIETALDPAIRRRFTYEQEQSRTLFRQDRSAIYGGFHLYTMPA